MSQYIDIHTHKHYIRHDVLSIIAVAVGARADIPSDGVFSAAIHPYDVRRVDISWFDTLAFAARNERCLALGETGLDQRSEYSDSIKQQTATFEEHIFLSNKLSKPLIIHSVRALEPVLKILKTAHHPFVIHGFRGSRNDADKIIKQGGYISIGHKITQDNALRERVADIPRDRILLETDDSELLIYDIYRSVAVAMNIQIDELKDIVEQNANRVFNLTNLK